MAEHRAAKLQKLNHFRRKLPYVSANAFAAIATAIAEEGAPAGVRSRNELRGARDTICKNTGPYGPILDHLEHGYPNGEVVIAKDFPGITAKGQSIPLRRISNLLKSRDHASLKEQFDKITSSLYAVSAGSSAMPAGSATTGAGELRINLQQLFKALICCSSLWNCAKSCTSSGSD